MLCCLCLLCSAKRLSQTPRAAGCAVVLHAARQAQHLQGHLRRTRTQQLLLLHKAACTLLTLCFVAAAVCAPPPAHLSGVGWREVRRPCTLPLLLPLTLLLHPRRPPVLPPADRPDEPSTLPRRSSTTCSLELPGCGAWLLLRLQLLSSWRSAALAPLQAPVSPGAAVGPASQSPPCRNKPPLPFFPRRPSWESTSARRGLPAPVHLH